MSAQSPAEAAPAPLSTTKLFLTIFPSIMLPMFLAVADQTIVATALPAIAASLGNVEQISWVVISYLLATTIAAPVYGRLGDVFGRRRVMYVGLAIFMVASVLCALAPSIVLLSLARLLQGLGGGGLMTSSQALIGETIPPRERGRYQGYLAAVVVSSSTFGPVAGGYLTQHFGWQSVFLVNIPIGLLAAVLMLRLPRRRSSDEAWQFDAMGLALFVLFVAPTLLAIEFAQRFEAGFMPLVIALAVCAVGALILLIRQEKRVASPLLPISLLSKAAIWRSDALAACHGAALVSLITFLPLYLRVVRGATASESGFLLLPLTAGIGLGSLVTGRLVSKTGRTFVFPSFGLIVSLATIIGLALGAPYLTPPQISGLLGVNALFMGTVMGVVNVTVQSAAGPRMLGAAAGSVQFSRSVGASIGTAIVGAVLFLSLATTDSKAAALLGAMVERGPDILAQLDPERQKVVALEIAHAFRAAFLTVSLFTAGALVLAWVNPARRV
ncbi:drug resistance transporter, EmrB/QacA subfamily [Rhizobiales bacterium GAS191]|nr:drug resistance transporter, EmrB/QacA subfamily [Rhizobiales bacterium GAS113]SEE19621.1 drug resistance transporter, EmrB/QacA subfamily [Rhizobiales bacterium GAS191]